MVGLTSTTIGIDPLKPHLKALDFASSILGADISSPAKRCLLYSLNNLWKSIVAFSINGRFGQSDKK
uniref:Uncharacterized protein n=1 Tax=Glossina palpalis gambiensis TaxID=67801 RepID=A0A1B0BDM0_9MUSC